jgi:glycosyltransferase involved in cell wall biosynthesis
MKDAVSVLIPTLERPHFLRAAIRSVLDQDMDGIQVVVGDDGDLGASVVAEVGDSRLRYVRNSERLGMAGNWNRLLELAETDFVMLLMDDDRLMPGFLTKCLAAFASNPDLGVVFTNHLFEEAGSLTERDSLIRGGRYDRFETEFAARTPVAVSAALLRMRAAREVMPLPDTPAADLALFGRIAARGWPFYYIDEPLMIYRVHGSNLSATPEFRTASVPAWESLHFNDPEAERLRQDRLAEALMNRAALRLQRGETKDAGADLARARQLAGRLDTRAAVFAFLSRHPVLARGATRGWRALTWVRAARRRAAGPSAARTRGRQ